MRHDGAVVVEAGIGGPEDVGGVDLEHPPSTYAKGRVYGCIFDDLHGLKSRDEVGMETILFECDFPHANGTFPRTRSVAHRLQIRRYAG